MIELYSFITPNGRKANIMLEECGLAYVAHPVNLLVSEQFKPEFLKISPNNRIPAIVDTRGPGGKPYSLFESGAILIYLAKKSRKFLPRRCRARFEVIEWLMFQMANIGPMFGQAHHSHELAPKKFPYAIKRYTSEANRLYGVLDKRLGGREYICERYSIADIACYSWVDYHRHLGVAIDDYPRVKRWLARMAARPGVRRGMAVMAEWEATIDDLLSTRAQESLRGKARYRRH
jgi:GST-like protein